MTTPNVVEQPAANLTFAQIEVGLGMGLFTEFEPRPGGGYTIYVNTTLGQSVQAVASFVNDPPVPDEAHDPIICRLCDSYLSIKAMLESVPVPPPSGDDPWATHRADLQKRLNSAWSALEAAGGP